MCVQDAGKAAPAACCVMEDEVVLLVTRNHERHGFGGLPFCDTGICVRIGEHYSDGSFVQTDGGYMQHCWFPFHTPLLR